MNILIQEPTMDERLNFTRLILKQDELWTVGDKDNDYKSSQLSENEITIQALSSIHYNKLNTNCSSRYKTIAIKTRMDAYEYY